MAQQVKVLTVLPEDLSSVPDTHIGWLTITFHLQLQGRQCPLLTSEGICTQVVQTHTYTYKKKMKTKPTNKQKPPNNNKIITESIQIMYTD